MTVFLLKAARLAMKTDWSHKLHVYFDNVIQTNAKQSKQFLACPIRKRFTTRIRLNYVKKTQTETFMLVFENDKLQDFHRLAIDNLVSDIICM